MEEIVTLTPPNKPLLVSEAVILHRPLMHALDIKYVLHRYVKCMLYVKGYSVADPPWSGYSLQHC